MKIELKRFTTNARLSQETTAFAADVWVDGKKAGYAENDGHGGATTVHLHLLDRATRDQVEAHGKKLVPAEYGNFFGGAEWIVDQLVEAELAKRADKSLARRLASADAKEKAKCEQRGLLSARFRHGDEWLYFAYKPTTDPKATAHAIAVHRKVSVDELVLL